MATPEALAFLSGALIERNESENHRLDFSVSCEGDNDCAPATEQPSVQHTPAPWYVAAEHGNLTGENEIAVCDGYSDEIIAAVWPMGDEDDTAEQQANARLIAAAPDLVTAAESLLEAIQWIGGIEPQRRAMIDALNKALGDQ